MGKIRKHSPHVKWTDREIIILRESYSEISFDVLENLLPGRHRRMIQCKANGLGLARKKKSKMTREEYLAAKREGMAKHRARDINLAREKQRNWHHKNRDKNCQTMRDYAGKRFFWSKAMKLRGDAKASYKEIAMLWRKQKGLCGLTGRRLNRRAQLDHILPKARNGGDEIGNLRWVCEDANIAKRHMTDDEFFKLCNEVMRWIGRRML